MSAYPRFEILVVQKGGRFSLGPEQLLLRDILGNEATAPLDDTTALQFYIRDRVRDDFAREQIEKPFSS